MNLLFQRALVSLTAFFVFVSAFIAEGISIQFFICIIVGLILLYLSVVDIKTMTIPDKSIVLLLLTSVPIIILSEKTIADHMIGFAAVSVPFLVTAMLYSEGIGGGDIKLAAAAGLILGWRHILLAFLIASLTGGIASAFLIIIRKKNLKSKIPFGPFLSLGAYISLLFGDKILEIYFGLYL